MAKKHLAKDAEEAQEQSDTVVPQYGSHVLIDFGGTGNYDVRPAPEGWHNDRTIRVDGVNCEHVGEGGELEPWKYRRM